MRTPMRILIAAVVPVCLLRILLCAECWAAQPYTPVHPDPVLEPWRWRSFPELKGLGLQCMAEDRGGRMWFGVDDGALHYDGRTWTTFTPEDGLLGAPVQTLCATRDGSVYAGTELGISRFRDGRWNRVFPHEGACQAFDLLEGSDGTLWAGTSLGALHFAGEQTTLYTTDSLRTARPELNVTFVMLPEGAETQVYDVYEDGEGRMWFGLYGGEILRYNIRSAELGASKPWRLYTAEDGLDIGFWPRINQTPDRVIWTVSIDAHGGVNRFDGQAWTHFHLSEIVAYNSNPSILVTRDGTLWVGGHGSYLYAYREGSWTNYRAPDVPTPPGRLSDLLEASDGALWVAGRRREALRLDLGASRWTTYSGLGFRCETSDGAFWFVSRDSGVVRYDGRTWTRYGVEDGLMDRPVTLIESRTGVLWAAGSQDSIAATARFDGTKWSVQTHPELSWNIYPGGRLGASDGSVWFSSGSHYFSERGQLGGLLRFDGEAWTHYVPPEAPPSAYAIAQTSDGSLWFGGNALRRFDGETWMRISEPEGVSSWVHSIHRSDEDHLWVGTRSDGIFRFDGQTWLHYNERDRLAADYVLGILQTEDSSIWAATSEGISRFDGQAWTTHALPPDLAGPQLWQSRDGSLWIFGTWRSIRYRLDVDPPETEITLSLDEVSQPGNTTLEWKGIDAWGDTPDEALQYAWRLDKGTWSVYSGRTNDVFLALASGDHTFEVKARDRDFNEDPTPASVTFTVVPPVWQEPWFIVMVILFAAAVGVQTGRVVRRDRRLRESNAALSMANKDLFGLNRELQRDRAVERVRAEVTAMKTADGLSEVVGEMLKELSEAGVDFDLCVINIVDEDAGIRKQTGATKQGWSGQAEMPLPEVSEAFMAIYRGGEPVVREADDDVVEACLQTRNQLEVTEALERPTAVVDAPFAYGTLSLQTHNPNGFTEEDVALVAEFARVIALGYARYLDFQSLEEQNRKLDASNAELTVEAALERVRAKALGMQESNDLDTVSMALFAALGEVGFTVWAAWIGIHNEEDDRFDLSVQVAGAEFLVTSTTPLSEVIADSVEARGVVEAWKRKEDFVFEISGAQWKDNLEYWASVVQQRNPSYVTPEELSTAERATKHYSPYEHGMVGFSAPKRIDDTGMAVLRRFADVFGFAYNRFLELQEKEERNRQLEVENALEHVRAKALGMQESRDLWKVSAALDEEFKRLEIPHVLSTVVIIDEERDFCACWPISSWLAESPQMEVAVSEGLPFLRASFKALLAVDPEIAEAVRARDQGEGFYTSTHSREEEIELRRSTGGVWILPDGRNWAGRGRDADINWERIAIHHILNDHGMLILQNETPLSEADITTVKRFSDVFDLAYTRFLEMQEKEARNRELEAANRAMSDANRELFAANQALQRDRAVERIRGEVQAMDQASDFEQVLSLLSEDLKAVGLSFDTCGIEVLDEPVDEPTMAYFQERGYRYTSYTIDPDGTVASNSYSLSAPFPPVVLETIERFIAGQPWRARTEQNAIVEVPMSGYGHLRLTSSDRPEFTDEDVEALKDFASALALGYARYLDIREIQEQAERKSVFLTNMSHELRSPMNSIIGFTRMVLRRAGDALPDRQKGNLEKVLEAANRLLGLINELMDLSKIEAGRMDVNVEAFDVRQLIEGCCAEAEPLVAEKPDVTLVHDVSDGVGEARTDKGRVHQIVTNLLSNAIKFTDQGEIAVRVSKVDEQLVVSVSDTGSGIPPDALETIFEEFQQVKGSDPQHKGTGLGLPICKGFAELLGGSIRVESEVGRGSIFTVRIPVLYTES